MPKVIRKPRLFDRPQTANDVVRELRRRKRQGHPLNSGANRGDWLYAAALRFFDNWGAAVEAAGIVYGDVRRAALGKDDVLRRIQALARRKKPLTAARVEPIIVAGAHRHFGSWANAVEAAGFTVTRRRKWSPEKVIAKIHAHQRAGRPVNSVALIKHDMALYGAGRKMFGNWATALAKAGVKAKKAARRVATKRGK